MKHLNLLLAAVAGSVLLSSCIFRIPDSAKFNRVKASGVTEVKAYNYDQVKSVSVEVADVEYTQSETISVEFEIDNALSGYYTVENVDGSLKVECNAASISGKPVHVLRISAPDITLFELSGASDLKFINGYRSENSLEIKTMGASDVDGGDFHVGELNITSSGASEINLTNIECTDLNLAIAGSGDVVVKNVVAKDILASIAGAGDVTVTGKADHAGVDIAGAGDVDFSQLDCENISQSVNGMGKVKTKKN